MYRWICMEFPIIQTDFWDGVIAVPLVVIITQLFKLVFSVPKAYVPTVATIIGFVISIFFSHRHDLWAGIFMGGFYGAAAVGTYSSLKNSFSAFRQNKKVKYR